MEAAADADGEHDLRVLANDMVIYVLSNTSPMMMWMKLEKMYMMKSLTNVFFLWK